MGQRKGLGLAGGTDPRYAVDVDPDAGRVTVGGAADLLVDVTPLESWRWVGDPPAGEVDVQCSAHGAVAAATVTADAVAWREPHRRVAPGQSIVAYLLGPGGVDVVVGGGTAARG